jgi:hypothetical protein
MSKQSVNIARALFQGFTGAGLFRRLNYPGAPAEFIDPRAEDEIHASGEVDRCCRIYNDAKYAKVRDDATRSRRAAVDKEAKAARARSAR